MIKIEGSEECHNCGCNLKPACDGYEGDEMSNKAVMSSDGGYVVYTTTDDGEHIYLEIDEPKDFEISSSHLMVKIPLDKWVQMTTEFLEKHNRHFKISDKQLELNL